MEIKSLTIYFVPLKTPEGEDYVSGLATAEVRFSSCRLECTMGTHIASKASDLIPIFRGDLEYYCTGDTMDSKEKLVKYSQIIEQVNEVVTLKKVTPVRFDKLCNKLNIT